MGFLKARVVSVATYQNYIQEFLQLLYRQEGFNHIVIPIQNLHLKLNSGMRNGLSCETDVNFFNCSIGYFLFKLSECLLRYL